MRKGEASAERGVEAALWLAARVVFVLGVVLLALVWMAPMPDDHAIPGRLPRVVVGE